jgi:hypothetical protein
MKTVDYIVVFSIIAVSISLLAYMLKVEKHNREGN